MGVPAENWREEPTGVHTDAQVFRALKALGEEVKTIGSDLTQNKLEAARAHGALKSEVAQLSKRMDATDGKLDDVATLSATVSGKIDVLLADRRGRSSSSETRGVIKETLAERVLAEQQAAAAHSRAVRLKLLGGVIAVLTSGAVIGAVIHWVAS
jgi:hypothetical protein